MRKITIYKASPVVEPVEDLHLSVTETVPKQADVRAAAKFYRAQGEHLAKRLYQTMPGGTIDALLVALLARKASVLRVRHP